LKIANRMSKVPDYIFAELESIENNLISQGEDIINLGIGDPDIPTPEFLVQKMVQYVEEKDNYNYSPYAGIDEFNMAVADYYKKNFDVQLDYKKEVITLIGSKEGIAHLFLSVTDIGDYVIIPNPSYPVYEAAAEISGCSVYKMSLAEKNNYIPKLENIYEDVAKRAKLLIVNYPNNPTGALANDEFYKKLVEFGKKNNIIIVNDSAYINICNNKNQRLSLLQFDKEKGHCIEFGTLSKSYNMSGWRIGYAAGCSEVIERLLLLKGNFDSGQFIPIQKTGAYALTHGDAFIDYINKIYKKRREIIEDALLKKNIHIYNSNGTFYIWFKVPSGYKSYEFSQLMLKKSGIMITPGTAFGDLGEGYCRISLTASDERIKSAAQRIIEMDF